MPKLQSVYNGHFCTVNNKLWIFPLSLSLSLRSPFNLIFFNFHLKFFFSTVWLYLLHPTLKNQWAQWYGSIHANGISATVRFRQIPAPLNCVFARKSLAHLRRSWQRSRAPQAHSAQFESYKRFINDKIVYRVTNKNHHGKTWSIHQPMLLLLLICRSIMTRRCSLHGLRGVRCYCLRGLLHDQKQYVLCVIHMDFDVFSKVINDQTMFCVVYVDLDVLSKVNHDQISLPSPRVRWGFLQGQSWSNECSAQSTWMMTSSPTSVMTRRCSA